MAKVQHHHSSRTTWLQLAGTLTLLGLALRPCQVAAYEPLDPLGNVTIVWDILSAGASTYTVNISIVNWQQLQTVRNWSLTWTWPGREIIVKALGAEATAQGNCKAFKLPQDQKPHSCLKAPTMVDLMPVEPPPVPGCCRDGLIPGLLHRTDPALSIFQMDIAGTKMSPDGVIPAPLGLHLGIPGYTCTPPFLVPELNHTSPGSRRIVSSYQTLNSVCTFRKPESEGPGCCVSFSAFYSESISPCPTCACACGSFLRTSALCLRSGDPASGTPYLTDGGSGLAVTQLPNSQICSPDGCPVHIRFHIKDNYKGFWRAKITAFNRQFHTNYSDWDIVVQHPSMAGLTQAFSFNVSFLQPFGVNNTAAFFGLPEFNDWLPAATTDTGPAIVQSELLLKKGDDFSLSEGWPFPKRVLFNGMECALPKEFPPLPSSGNKHKALARGRSIVLAFCVVLSTLMMFLTF